MKAKLADIVRRIRSTNIMRVHFAAIGKADRSTGSWVDAGDDIPDGAGGGLSLDSSSPIASPTQGIPS